MAAINAGRFRDEIVPVSIPQRKGDPIIVDTDEHPRMTLGSAIGDAEVSGDPLVLTVLRSGRKTNVEVPLPQSGDWTGSPALGSETSRAVLDDACQVL